MDAIETAMDGVTDENYLAFSMVDKAGVLIANLELWRTNGDLSNIKNYHND